jgi:hypothetical protein
MITFEVIKCKVQVVAKSHHTWCGRSSFFSPKNFTSLEKNLQSHCSEHWGSIDTVRKFPVHFDVDVSMMAVLSSIENDANVIHYWFSVCNLSSYINFHFLYFTFSLILYFP